MYECGQTNVGEVDSIPRHFQFAVDVSQETQVGACPKLIFTSSHRISNSNYHFYKILTIKPFIY